MGEFSLIVFLNVSIIMVFQIIMYLRGYWKFNDEAFVDRSFNPTVSILIPAYNEEKTIVSSVKSALKQTYNAEVIVVNDGSTDRTLEILRSEFKLKRRNREMEWYSDELSLKVFHKTNGGKSDALNYGMEKASGDWILAVDADSFLLPKTLETLISKKRSDAIAMTCGIGMINGCKVEDGVLCERKISSNLLVVSQMIEYLRTFVMLKMSMDYTNGTAIISGACGFFDKKYVQDLGGYRKNLTEDADLTLRIHKEGGKVQFISDVLSYTEAPTNPKILQRQRMRWIRGLWRNIKEHRKDVKTKSIKNFLIPYFFIADYILPWFEFLGWTTFAVLSFVNPAEAIPTFFALILLYILFVVNNLILLTIGAKKMNLAMEYEDKWKILIVSFTDIFYYRPLMLFFVIKAELLELFGKTWQWGKMERKGF